MFAVPRMPPSAFRASAGMETLFANLVEPGDKVLSMDLAHGGHLTHGNPVNFSGLRYQIVGEADYDDAAQQAPVLELLK